MSYLNQAQDPRRRAGALAGTVAINAAIGILVVTGLTMSGFGPKPKGYTPIISIRTPPPPPEPTQPAEISELVAPKPVAPQPQIPLPPLPSTSVDEFDSHTVIPDVIPRPDPGPAVIPTPRPAPSFTPTAARPINGSASWVGTDDYPRRSLIDGSEGMARYRLVIGTNGRVSSCEVTASTGDRQLDDATCRFITRRAKFEPATDETGAKVLGTYTGSVKWEIPD